MNGIDKQFEMFLRDGATRCYLDKGVLIYEFNHSSVPCLPPDGEISVEVKIDGSALWFVFHAGWEPLVGEGFDLTQVQITCPLFYAWCEKESLNWLKEK